MKINLENTVFVTAKWVKNHISCTSSFLRYKFFICLCTCHQLLYTYTFPFFYSASKRNRNCESTSGYLRYIPHVSNHWIEFDWKRGTDLHDNGDRDWIRRLAWRDVDSSRSPYSKTDPSVAKNSGLRRPGLAWPNLNIKVTSFSIRILSRSVIPPATASYTLFSPG